MTTSRDPAVARLRLRHFPGYVRFWTASTLSDFGSAITTLALQVLVLTSLGGTATDVGAVSSARWAAYLVLGLVAGMWIDRVRRRPVLVVTDLFRGLLLGAVCGLALTSRLTMAGLLVLIAAFGVFSLFHDSADQSFLPSLMPRSLLTRANARLELSTAVAQTSGPAVAGLLIRLLSAPVAILLDALSYLLGAVVLLSIRSPEVKVVRPARAPTARAEIAEGLRWMYRHRLLATLAVNDHLWFFCWAVLNTVLVTYALTGLGMGAFALGITLAVAGVGAVAGTSISERAAERWGAGRVMFVARLFYAPATVLTALAPAAHGSEARWSALVLFATAQLVIGVAMGAEGPVEMGFRQALTPDRLQGRTNTTIRSVNRTMIAIGAPVGGLLGDHLGLRPHPVDRRCRLRPGRDHVRVLPDADGPGRRAPRPAVKPWRRPSLWVTSAQQGVRVDLVGRELQGELVEGGVVGERIPAEGGERLVIGEDARLHQLTHGDRHVHPGDHRVTGQPPGRCVGVFGVG